jgi:hypothetical protein
VAAAASHIGVGKARMGWKTNGERAALSPSRADLTAHNAHNNLTSNTARTSPTAMEISGGMSSVRRFGGPDARYNECSNNTTGPAGSPKASLAGQRGDLARAGLWVRSIDIKHGTLQAGAPRVFLLEADLDAGGYVPCACLPKRPLQGQLSVRLRATGAPSKERAHRKWSQVLVLPAPGFVARIPNLLSGPAKPQTVETARA